MSQPVDLQKEIDAAAQRHRRLKPACESSASMHTVRAIRARVDLQRRLAVTRGAEKLVPELLQWMGPMASSPRPK
jgi:hypothetical protein